MSAPASPASGARRDHPGDDLDVARAAAQAGADELRRRYRVGGVRETATTKSTYRDLVTDADRAAESFIDYWMGKGAWAHTPEPRKPAIAESVKNVRGWAQALMGEPTLLAAFSALDIPVLYMTGKKSPASSLGVARRLMRVLPKARLVEFDGLGHMAPLTHPEQVNPVISQFLSNLV